MYSYLTYVARVSDRVEKILEEKYKIPHSSGAAKHLRPLLKNVLMQEESICV